MAGTLVQARFANPAGSMHPSSGINPAKYVQAATLIANTPQNVTIPKGTKFALFSGEASFYANFAGPAAVVPVGSVTDGSASVLNPGMRSVELEAQAADYIVSVIAAVAINVTVECWS